ncbi:unnamed protein product [Mucor fragilis]
MDLIRDGISVLALSLFPFCCTFRCNAVLILVTVLLLCKHIQAFLSVDSDTVHSYHLNDSVPLVVNKITSIKTQVPFAYGELPFACPSYDTTRRQQRSLVNLGHILQGDRYMKSSFEVGGGIQLLVASTVANPYCSSAWAATATAISCARLN